MKQLMGKYQLKESHDKKNLFLDLVGIVTGQQLSMKAADTIFKRFLNLYSDSSYEALREVGPTPEQILKTSVEKLRSVGLSNSKACYVHNIATAVSSGTLPIDQFEKLTDEEIKKELIKIKGIGPWSAEMFLMFSLERPDIFSIGDLGLRTAIERLYDIKRDNLKKIAKLSQSWKPFRTLASRLLWASLENV